ncbi:MAG: helix-turn-helix domain-containing protein [Pseudonocardiaceae bacterium]
MRPALWRRWELRLSLAEREEISRGLAADLSFRAIATGLGRSPSTVSREVMDNGGRAGYRAAWSRSGRRGREHSVRSRPSSAATRVGRDGGGEAGTAVVATADLGMAATTVRAVLLAGAPDVLAGACGGLAAGPPHYG